MPYVRERGNQVAIVHGRRDRETGKVLQEILFTLYSRDEALEALGRREPGGEERFRRLLENEYPDIRFNWKTIRKSISERMSVLPEVYEYRSERLSGKFRQDLCAFTRQLILADPQDLQSAAQLIQEHRHELEYVSGLIEWRVKLRDQEASPWNGDNPFYWRFAMRGREVPPDTEEAAAHLYETCEYEQASAVFRLLVDCFDGYAEGYNYLGLIALRQENLEEAIVHFRKTMEVGRKLFSARIARNRYWSDHSTRPYMRGLRNLTLTLNQAGRYKEALDLCGRLEQECGDDTTALAFRAAIYLNTGHWQPAVDAALSLNSLFPSESFTAALALCELGRYEDAFAMFLHGALNNPRTARMIVGMRQRRPATSVEVRHHNEAVEITREMNGYLANPRRASRRFFGRILKNQEMLNLLDESEAVESAWYEQRQEDGRELLEEMNRMRGLEFAKQKAAELADVVVSMA